MNKRIQSIASCAVASAVCLATSAFTLTASADSSRLCAKSSNSNCYIAGNFPPSIAQGFGITDESSLVVRFYNGEWSMGGHVIGTFAGPDWIPVVGDWDGDGYDNVGVYRNGTWILKTSWNFIDPQGDVEVHTFGDPSWTPIPGDWNNDSKDELGLYKLGTFRLLVDADRGTAENQITFENLTFTTSPGSLGPAPIVGSFGDQADVVGIIENQSAKYASSAVTATYDFQNPGGGMMALVVGNSGPRNENLAPIVINGYDPFDSTASGARLVFSRPPEDGEITVCPGNATSTERCAWLVTSVAKPEEGGYTDIPDPEIF